MSDETILRSKAPQLHVGKSLLDYLSARFRYQTPETWKELVLSGKVRVNGKKSEPSLVLQKDDWVEYSVALNEPPVDRNIAILFEEETFLVASKPGQLPSHADGNFIKNTFIYLLTEKLRVQGYSGEAKLVHRLDRETSGLLVVAKEKNAHRRLVDQFEKGQVEKEYWAVVRGSVPEEKMEANGAIAKDQDSQISIRHKAVPEGTPFSKPSLTLFEKIKDLKDGALLRCLPKTGRTNQIRVHLASLGHPLVGDKLYGRTDEEFLEFIQHVKAGGGPDFESRLGAPRHLLHAARLSFTHPQTGKPISFEAPMPPDMRDYVGSHSQA